MRLDQLNFHHLFYFWRVATLGHLTRAALEIHTSQSALSAQIRQLEERLGESLFVREGRRLVLTEQGHLVFSYAEEIFGLGQEMLGQLQGQGSGIVRLRIGSVATLSRNYQENLLQPLLADDQIVLTLESGLLEGLLERLVRHQLDVVLANETSASQADRPLHCRHLGSQPMSIVGAAARWRRRQLHFPRDLDGLDMALPGTRHAVRRQFDAMCAAAGVSPRVRADVDDMAMLRLIARDSDWLTLLPQVVVQDELRQQALVVAGSLDDLHENFYAITVPRRHRLPVLDTFLGDPGR